MQMQLVQTETGELKADATCLDNWTQQKQMQLGYMEANAQYFDRQLHDAAPLNYSRFNSSRCCLFRQG